MICRNSFFFAVSLLNYKPRFAIPYCSALPLPNLCIVADVGRMFFLAYEQSIIQTRTELWFGAANGACCPICILLVMLIMHLLCVADLQSSTHI